MFKSTKPQFQGYRVLEQNVIQLKVIDYSDVIKQQKKHNGVEISHEI